MVFVFCFFPWHIFCRKSKFALEATKWADSLKTKCLEEDVSAPFCKFQNRHCRFQKWAGPVLFIILSGFIPEEG